MKAIQPLTINYSGVFFKEKNFPLFLNSFLKLLGMFPFTAVRLFGVSALNSHRDYKSPPATKRGFLKGMAGLPIQKGDRNIYGNPAF